MKRSLKSTGTFRGSGHEGSFYVRLSENRGFFRQIPKCPKIGSTDEIADNSVFGQENGQMFLPRSCLAYVKPTFVFGPLLR